MQSSSYSHPLFSSHLPNLLHGQDNDLKQICHLIQPQIPFLCWLPWSQSFNVRHLHGYCHCWLWEFLRHLFWCTRGARPCSISKTSGAFGRDQGSSARHHDSFEGHSSHVCSNGSTALRSIVLHVQIFPHLRWVAWSFPSSCHFVERLKHPASVLSVLDHHRMGSAKSALEELWPR